MWTLKYQPKELSEVIGLSESVFKNINPDMKHMMFISISPGTGKSTTANIIQKMVDPNNHNTLRVNASDERGIDVIRDKVKSFAMTAVNPGSDFKLVRMEESDRLTMEAQDSLREITEKYEKNCRFIFTGNQGHKFSLALKSRCMVIDFKIPDKTAIKKHLINILTKENIEFEEEAVKKVVIKCFPDIRSMITKLEELSKQGKITLEKVSIDEDKIMVLIDSLKKDQFLVARKWVLDSNQGISHIISILHTFVIKDKTIENKTEVLETLGEFSYRLGFATDEEVMISWGLIQLMKVLK